MYRCRFMAPSITTSSLLPPWWIAPDIMTVGQRFPSLGWTKASINPCLRRTQTRPSLWYRGNRDSSLKMSPLFEVPHSVPPPPLTVASPVLQNEPRTSGWTPRPISGVLSLRMARTDIRLQNRWIICIGRRGAEMKRFVLNIRSSWRSPTGTRTSLQDVRWRAAYWSRVPDVVSTWLNVWNCNSRYFKDQLKTSSKR